MRPLIFRESSERNKQPILDKLLSFLPAHGRALEIASGTGQHVEWFAQHMPGWSWQPTEQDADAISVIDARVAQSGLCNVQAAGWIDVIKSPWQIANEPRPVFDLIYCCNMLHVAPYEACAGLMQGAAAYLHSSGKLAIYGPFFEKGNQPAPSNLEFDKAMRAIDSRRGVRWLHDLEREAHQVGLTLESSFAMPANNLLLVWERQ
jgi:cyclopropane fatty-acyl-phospholipid synthase-like methyltransferase